MSASYVEKLDYLLGIDLAIEFITDPVYDSAHGFNEMHRYTCGSGKQTEHVFTAVPWPRGCTQRSPRLSGAACK